MGDELVQGQSQTDTHAGNDNTWRPKVASGKKGGIIQTPWCQQLLTLYVLFFSRENINIYLHFMSFLHTKKTEVVEIPPRVRQGSAYST